MLIEHMNKQKFEKKKKKKKKKKNKNKKKKSCVFAVFFYGLEFERHRGQNIRHIVSKII
jgi:translation elongation factor EF-1alpha